MDFLDDIYAVCSPDRVGAVFAIVEQEMQARAHVRMHHGKTQFWNRGGVVPDGIEELTVAARLVKSIPPNAEKCHGNATTKTNDNNMSNEAKCETNCSINNK